MAIDLPLFTSTSSSDMDLHTISQCLLQLTQLQTRLNQNPSQPSIDATSPYFFSQHRNGGPQHIKSGPQYRK
ncbi:hypothetical protein PIB30_103840, partial [Stylosanthes scabra]|nr:hypothetical protein [Stylosanthes scabra]